MTKLFVLLSLVLSFSTTYAADLQVGDDAPVFKIKDHENKDFDLASRKNSWTVLYFYPKAETPGCTTQACAFRDNINKIRNQQAEVIGISINSVEDQAAFHKKHKLNFTLLADEDGAISKRYGSKMFLLNMSKRWTYIIGPDLKIRSIDKDVDPAKDAASVAQKIADLKGSQSK